MVVFLLSRACWGACRTPCSSSTSPRVSPGLRLLHKAPGGVRAPQPGPPRHLRSLGVLGAVTAVVAVATLYTGTLGGRWLRGWWEEGGEEEVVGEGKGKDKEVVIMDSSRSAKDYRRRLQEAVGRGDSQVEVEEAAGDTVEDTSGVKLEDTPGDKVEDSPGDQVMKEGKGGEEVDNTVVDSVQ